ncbi:MAG: AI-2E family transporter [Cyanobacteria bacterium]|nr:AI-2E family transporter [Cyanobacteriota bacterium]MDW8199855.1 AI-2E family transporter [Cyanobacteriota bacterium SKYGB_h_bin112]
MKFGQWLGLIVTIISLYILWEIRQLILLLFVAVVFSTALNRPTRWLQRLRLQRKVAAIISVTSILSLLVVFFATIIPPFLEQFQQLVELVPRGFEELRQEVDRLTAGIPGGIDQFLPTSTALFQQFQPIASGLANNFFKVFSGFFNVTISILFVIMVTIMLLIEPDAYRRRFLKLVPSFYRHRADEILTACEADLVGWIVGALINMVVIGVTSGIVLTFLGVRLVLANALLAGLLEAIPNLGPFLSTVPPVAIALLDAPLKGVLVLVSYIIIQVSEQFLLVPVVMGQQVSLLPAVTLIAQFAFAYFFGFLGLFLAIPLVIIVRILVRETLVRDVLDQWTASLDETLPDAIPTDDICEPFAVQLALPEPKAAPPESEEFEADDKTPSPEM